jgi:hypothetical protein
VDGDPRRAVEVIDLHHVCDFATWDGLTPNQDVKRAILGRHGVSGVQKSAYPCSGIPLEEVITPPCRARRRSEGDMEILAIPLTCFWTIFPLFLIVLFARFIRRRDPKAALGWVVFLCLVWAVWITVPWLTCLSLPRFKFE